MIELPDVPRWVEAHGIAADSTHWREPMGAGFALGHDDMKLIVIAGDADATAVGRAAQAHASHTLLFAIEREDIATTIDRPVERAILHTLPDPSALPDLEGAVLLPNDADVPPAFAEELAWARGHGPIWTAVVNGVASSFAYAPWRSAKYFDVSIDTMPGARQLGLATIVAAAMIRDERSRGREPVWGADEGNVASLRLAKRLGFQPVDELWVAPCAR